MHSSIPCDSRRRQMRFSLQPPLALCFFSTTTTTASLAGEESLQGCRASCTALACRIGYTLPGAPGIPARGADDAHDTVPYFLALGPRKPFWGGMKSTVTHASNSAPFAREEDGVGPRICAHAVLFYCLIPLCSFYPHTPFHRAAPGGFVSQPGHCCLGT